MLKKAISIIYIVSVLICLVCVPLSAIMIIIKLCAATSLSWIGCCIPLIVAIAISPFLIICKVLIDEK